MLWQKVKDKGSDHNIRLTAALVVADDLADKRFGKDFYDLDQKQQTDIYGEALDGLDDTDKFAQGGRAGGRTGGPRCARRDVSAR